MDGFCSLLCTSLSPGCSLLAPRLAPSARLPSAVLCTRVCAGSPRGAPTASPRFRCHNVLRIRDCRYHGVVSIRGPATLDCNGMLGKACNGACVRRIVRRRRRRRSRPWLVGGVAGCCQRRRPLTQKIRRRNRRRQSLRLAAGIAGCCQRQLPLKNFAGDGAVDGRGNISDGPKGGPGHGGCCRRTRKSGTVG